MTRPVKEVVELLLADCRTRSAMISARLSIENQARSFIGLALGFDAFHLTEAERKEIRKRTARIIEAYIKGKKQHPDDERIWGNTKDFVSAVLAGHDQLCHYENEKLKDMDRHAKMLPAPILKFQESVAGFGVRGLGMIVGLAAGDNHMGPTDFSTRKKFRSRLGLANSDEANYRQKTKFRRGQLWSFLYDALLRQQWLGDKDEDGNSPSKSGKPVAVAAHPIGPYGEIYGRMKARYMQRVVDTAHLPPGKDKWVPKRADFAARRAMAQRLLDDLWRVWRETIPPLGESSQKSVSPASSSASADAAADQCSSGRKPHTRSVRRRKPSPLRKTG